MDEKEKMIFKKSIIRAFKLLGEIKLDKIRNKEDRNKIIQVYDELFNLQKMINRS